MTLELMGSLALFAFVSSVTPGPNNTMLMASGANFGFARTIPHALGVALGFAIMMAILGAGLIEVFAAYPVIYKIMVVLASIYMLFLAYKVATAAPQRPDQAAGKPLTFLQAALFQWVNPKAVGMAIAAITNYTPDQTLGQVLLASSIFALINLPSVSIWTIAGIKLRRFLENPLRLRIFNYTMAALLLLSLVAIFAFDVKVS